MRLRVFAITLIFIASTISPTLASDTVTTNDMEISGNYVLSGNITVSHGTTLTIKPGTTLDMQSYWIKVDGNLIANNAVFMSSIQSTGSGSHNSGVWDDITISSMGSASIHNVTISNAKSCLINDGSLMSSNLTLQDCIIGIENAGTATIADLSASDIDQEAIRNTGVATLSDVSIQNMTGGIQSSGDLNIDTAEFNLVGYGLSLSGGVSDIEGLTYTSSIGAAISIFSGASGHVNDVQGTATNVITSMDSTGFTFSNLTMSGSRLINSWSAGDITIDGATFESTTPETPIDIISSGSVSLSEINLTGQFSSLQGQFDAPWIGVSLGGSGDYSIASSSFETSDTALKASGTGTLQISDSTFSSDRVGLMLSGIAETNISNSVVNISSDGEIAIDILQGHHSFENLQLNMPFSAFGTGTIGLESWWSDIESESITINGFAEGMKLHETVMSTEDLTIYDSNELGLGAYSSSVTITDLYDTRVSDIGLELESSIATIRTWASATHEDAATIDSDSELTVWSFSSVDNLFYDAKGDGILNYGTSQNLILQVAEENRIWDVTVSFEDLFGNPVDATWESLGFTGVASSGSAMVPVSESGSLIVATFASVGTSTTTNGAQDGTLTMRVPIMPQSSDWTLPAGETIVLGKTANGEPHVAAGNITIPANTILIIQESELQLPSNAKLEINYLGELDGVEGKLVGDVISYSEGLSGNEVIQDFGETSLTIDGDVLWTNCQNSIQTYNLHISGDVQLDSSCQVTMNSGSADGLIDIGTGASFEIVNTLVLTVLDKGEPIEGATISVQGQSQSVQTDANGQATRTASALIVDSSGIDESYIENITMQWGDVTEYLSWNPTSSKEHTFMISTIQGGELTDWLHLEKIWSPYYLSSDLVIPQGQTMTIDDGVALRVSDQVTITVEGTMNAGYSTISSTGGGDRWGGLIVGSDSVADLNIIGTNLVEGSPLISVTGQSDVLLTNALLSRSSGAEPLLKVPFSSAPIFMTIANSVFSDSATNCIELNSVEVFISNTEIRNCEDYGIWARGSFITMDDLDISGDLYLEGVDGNLDGLIASDLSLHSLDGFTLTNLNVDSITGANNRDILIEDAEINGSPGIDFDQTSGELNDLEIDCGGAGVGVISHHGLASSSIQISDTDIHSCTKGVDLHTDGETSPLVLHNVSVAASVAISSDGNPVIVRDGSLVGSLEINNTSADLYDVEPTMSVVYYGEVTIWSSHIISAELNGNQIEADFDLVVEGELLSKWEQSGSGNSIVVSIPHIVIQNNSTTETYSAVTISATATNLPSIMNEYQFGLDEDQLITVLMTSNQAPIAEIIVPDEGFRSMETIPIEIKALVSDDLDDNSDLIIEWNVVVGQTSLMQLFGEWNNITDLEEGEYVLTLEVTDKQGLSTTDSIGISVTLLDSDGDWISTCNIENTDNWYDKEESLNCGPDVYDIDDDNDGIIDSIDNWPLDPCAHLDTDGDGQPDNLNCPPGITTWLTVDSDDDGDGIPDELESSESKEADEEGGSVLIIVFVFLFLAAAVILLRRNQGVE